MNVKDKPKERPSFFYDLLITLNNEYRVAFYKAIGTSAILTEKSTYYVRTIESAFQPSHWTSVT